MSRLWKVKQIDDSGSRPVKLERPIEHPATTRAPDHIERKKPEDPDSVTQLMIELRLSQAEAQKRLEEQMVFMRDVFTKSVSSMPQTPLQPRRNAPSYSPNQYGNREYPPSAGCKSTVFYRTPAPIIVYYFLYITCLLYVLFLITHVRTSG